MKKTDVQDVVDELHKERDQAYDNEDYDLVRSINVKLYELTGSRDYEDIDELDEDDNDLFITEEDEEF